MIVQSSGIALLTQRPFLANVCFLAALALSLLFARRVRARRDAARDGPRRPLPTRDLALIVAAFMLFGFGIALSL